MTEQQEEVVMKAYGAGLTAGQKHKTPSPETRERLKQMEDNLNNLSKDVSDIKEDVGYIKGVLEGLKKSQTDSKEVHDGLSNRIRKVEVAYAKQSAVIAIVAVIGTGLFYMVLDWVKGLLK